MRPFIIVLSTVLGLISSFGLPHENFSADSGEHYSRPYREHLSIKVVHGSPAANWQMKRAASIINTAADEGFFVEAADSPDISLSMVKQIDNNKGILGICSIDTQTWKAEVQIVTGLNDQQRLAVMTHELIHALGISHSSNPNSLMFWSTNTRPNSQILTDDDLLNIRSAIEDFKTK